MPGGLAGDVLGPRECAGVLILLWSATVAGLGMDDQPDRPGNDARLFRSAQAGAYPNLSKVTRSWFPLSIRTSVQGAVASLSGRAGGALRPLIVATLLMGTLGLGWRAALMVIGAAGAFWEWRSGCCSATVRPSIPGPTWPSRRKSMPAELPIRAGHPAEDCGSGAANLVTMGAMLLYAFCSNFADQFFVNWLPLFLKEGKGLSQTQMGMFASLPLWGGALGGMAGGVLNDFLIRRTGSRRWARSGVAFTGKALAALLLAVSIFLADGRAVAVTLLACKFFADWSQSTQWGAITDIGGRAAGTVFGAVNMVGAMGSVLANPLIGRVKQDHGWEVLFFLLAGVFLASALVWLFIDSSRRLVTEDAPSTDPNA